MAYSNRIALCANSPFSSWSTTSIISAVESSSSGRSGFRDRHAKTYIQPSVQNLFSRSQYNSHETSKQQNKYPRTLLTAFSLLSFSPRLYKSRRSCSNSSLLRHGVTTKSMYESIHVKGSRLMRLASSLVPTRSEV